MKLTEQQIQQATQARIAQALAAVQRAQDELGNACGMLSALNYGSPAWKKCHKLTDTVHTFWYTVDALRQNRKVRLDDTNIQALEQRMAAKEATT